MTLRIAEEFHVLENHSVIVPCRLRVLGSGIVKADGLVMGDAVAKILDGLKFVVNGSLSKAVGLCREDLQQALPACGKRLLGKQVSPEAKGHR